MTTASFRPARDQKRYAGEVIDVEAREVSFFAAPKAPAATPQAAKTGIVRPFFGGRVTVTPFPFGVKVAPRVISASVTPIVDLTEETLQIAKRDAQNAQNKLEGSTSRLMDAFVEFCEDLTGVAKAERRVFQLESQIRKDKKDGQGGK